SHCQFTRGNNGQRAPPSADLVDANRREFSLSQEFVSLQLLSHSLRTIACEQLTNRYFFKYFRLPFGHLYEKRSRKSAEPQSWLAPNRRIYFHDRATIHRPLVRIRNILFSRNGNTTKTNPGRVRSLTLPTLVRFHWCDLSLRQAVARVLTRVLKTEWGLQPQRCNPSFSFISSSMGRVYYLHEFLISGGLKESRA
ncbi:hypothetical protein CEXT_595071, partial [Caerostris extrusa]